MCARSVPACEWKPCMPSCRPCSSHFWSDAINVFDTVFYAPQQKIDFSLLSFGALCSRKSATTLLRARKKKKNHKTVNGTLYTHRPSCHLRQWAYIVRRNVKTVWHSRRATHFVQQVWLILGNLVFTTWDRNILAPISFDWDSAKFANNQNYF